MFLSYLKLVSFHKPINILTTKSSDLHYFLASFSLRLYVVLRGLLDLPAKVHLLHSDGSYLSPPLS